MNKFVYGLLISTVSADINPLCPVDPLNDPCAPGYWLDDRENCFFCVAAFSTPVTPTC